MKMGGQYAGYNYYPQYGAQHTQGDHQDQRRTRGGGGGGHRQPGGGTAGPRKDYRGGNSNKYSNGTVSDLCCSLFDRHHSPFDLADAQMAFWAQGTIPRRTQAAARRLPPHLALPPPPLPSPTQTPEDPRRLRLIATTGSSEGSLAPAPATTGSRRAPRLTPPPLRPPIPNQARVRIVAHLGLAATRRLK